MQEREAAIDTYQSYSDFLDLVDDASRIERKLASIYEVRDSSPGRFLPEEKYRELKFYHSILNGIIVELLLQRRDNPEINFRVGLKKQEGERFHPFSVNDVVLYVPSVENPAREHPIPADLFDIRREGVSENSIEALSLLGQVKVMPESEQEYIMRTLYELMKIRAEREKIINEQESKYTLVSLRRRTLQLIKERLVGKEEVIIDTLPNLRKITFYGEAYWFPIWDPKRKHALASI